MRYEIVNMKNAQTAAFETHMTTALEKFNASAAEKNESLDILFILIGLPPMKVIDYEQLATDYQEVAIGLLHAVSCKLARMETGTKRICLIIPKSASNNAAAGETTVGGWERIVYAACDMAVKTLFNKLRPLGFTFRVYGVTDMTDEREAACAADYCLADRSFEEWSLIHSDEERLVMRDCMEREIPW